MLALGCFEPDPVDGFGVVSVEWDLLHGLVEAQPADRLRVPEEPWLAGVGGGRVSGIADL